MESRLKQPVVDEPDQPGDQAEPAAPRPVEALSLGRAVTNVGERIQGILDQAERIAAQIRIEAEAESAEYAHQRRREADHVLDEQIRELAALTESLAARAASVERETSALISEVETAMRRMNEVTGRERVVRPGGGSPMSMAPQPVAYPGTAATAKTREQATLRATQMAVAGTERTEIERMLRSEFGIEDPAAVVEDMLRTDRA